jgi:hypothetical protein
MDGELGGWNFSFFLTYAWEYNSGMRNEISIYHQWYSYSLGYMY